MLSGPSRPPNAHRVSARRDVAKESSRLVESVSYIVKDVTARRWSTGRRTRGVELVDAVDQTD